MTTSEMVDLVGLTIETWRNGEMGGHLYIGTIQRPGTFEAYICFHSG